MTPSLNSQTAQYAYNLAIILTVIALFKFVYGLSIPILLGLAAIAFVSAFAMNIAAHDPKYRDH